MMVKNRVAFMTFMTARGRNSGRSSHEYCKPLIDLYLISEKSIWKNQIRLI